jgi:hypothetical protein
MTSRRRLAGLTTLAGLVRGGILSSDPCLLKVFDRAFAAETGESAQAMLGQWGPA